MHTEGAQGAASMHVENNHFTFGTKEEVLNERPSEQSNGPGENVEDENSGQNGILSTISDQTNFGVCQPIRSAGRKKTHPVWLFFRDLRDMHGTGHPVSCLHCNWAGNDRSPNNLRAHLKRCHEADGQYQLFMAALAQSMWGHMKAFHSDVVGQRTFLLKRKRRVRLNGVLVDPEEDESAATAIATAAVEAAEAQYSLDDLSALSPSAVSDSSPGQNLSASEFLLSLAAENADETRENSDGTDGTTENNCHSTPTQPYVKRKRCPVTANDFHGDGSEESPSGLLASILQSTAKFEAQHASNSANEENGLAPASDGSLTDSAAQDAGSSDASEMPPMDSVAARQKAECLTTEEFSNLVQALQSSTAATANASSLATSIAEVSMPSARPLLNTTNSSSTIIAAKSFGATVSGMDPAALVPQQRFWLSDPIGLFQLYRIALDLELTFSTHGRRGVPEFCFESNRTVERSGARGRMLSFSETLNEVLLTERVNGAPVSTETWRKLDFSQLMWAIRGKCHARFLSN